MNLDFNSTQSTRYLQVYNYYKDLIVTGRLMPGTKMPSIRRGAIQLGLSRTTIETAYLCLAADGYIYFQTAERILCHRPNRDGDLNPACSQQKLRRGRQSAYLI